MINMGLFSKYINREKQIIKPGKEKKTGKEKIIERCHVINCRYAKTFTLFFFFTIFKIKCGNDQKKKIKTPL